MENIFSSLLAFETPKGSVEQFFKWLEERSKANEFYVERIDLRDLDKWRFAEDSGNLVHETGKFFSIEGIKVNTSFGNVNIWEQVIINQPEVGILGIITKMIDNERHFLLQAKMEPGNINILQLSPTLQATKSNYKLEHKGKSPLYLEYFIDKTKAKIVVDQLQSEQGGRFLRKRNRNMIVEVTEDIPVYEDYIWLTLGQVKKLMQYDNLMNMDARSVISCIPFHKAADFAEINGSENGRTLLDSAMIASLSSDEDDIYSFTEQLSWIIDQKLGYSLTVESVNLNTLTDWVIGSDRVYHKSLPLFEVIGVDVRAGNREVGSWKQPMIADYNTGLIGFIVKEINNKYYFLVQAKLEPGNIDIVDMAPTISCSNYLSYVDKESAPLFYNKFLDVKPENIIYDKLLSEEGGRFYHLQNRYMIIRDNELDLESMEPNYRFMTLEHMLTIAEQGYFNIESRGLFACIDFFENR